MAEEKISPAVVIGGLVLALAAVLGVAAAVWAGPPPPGDIYCPYCGAGPFATLDEVNAHITAEHPGEPLLIHIEWE